jgi:hypothetical protein
MTTKISDSNTTRTLTSSFTGSLINVAEYSSVSVSCISDVAGSVSIKQSINGSNWDKINTLNVRANIADFITITLPYEFLQVTWAGTSGTTGRLSTKLHADSSESQSKVEFSDSPIIDAFGRLRVSNLHNIFESKQIFDNDPLKWDESLESGGGITTAHSTDRASTTMTSTLNTAGTFTRQTFMRFNYNPGKSQLIIMTGILLKSGGGTGVQIRIGQFDDNNGLFFQYNAGTVSVVVRTNVSGTPVDTGVNQTAWNGDTMDGNGKSGLTVDWTKLQIFIIDYGWLGAGRVRFAVMISGIIYPVHNVYNSNVLSNVYMSTPNNPLRFQMITTSSSPVTKTEQVCSLVATEGGSHEGVGIIRSHRNIATVTSLDGVGTTFLVCGIRLKSTHLGATVIPLTTEILLITASDDLEWSLILDPTIAGTAPTWTNLGNSAVQTTIGIAVNTITNGTLVDCGFLSTGSGSAAGSQTVSSVNNALLIGANIAGTVQTLCLCITPITGANLSVRGKITWREL